MTRRRLLPILLIMALLIALLLVACDGNAYRVNFYDGETLIFSYAVKKGGDLDEIPEVPYKEGKVGVWSVTNFDAINSDITVYAIYSEAKYTIRFFVEDELIAERKVNRKSSLNDIPAVPERIGYRGSWNVSDFSDVNRNIDVQAVYVAVDSSVTFNVNGEVLTTVFIAEGSDLTEIPAVPAYPNKNYSSKWVSGSADSDEDAVFTNVKGELNVYAHYYLTVGTANGDVESFDCEIGEEIQAPAIGRKVGYDFVGWYGDADFVEKIVFPTTFEENVTIYARWLSSAGDPSDFTFDNGVVTGYVGSGTEAVIPYKYVQDGVDVLVTGIADGAFASSSLTKITLPSTLKDIGDEAFKNSSSLSEIIFADGSYVETIGTEAFSGCVALKSFDFSSFTVSIGERAFNNCASVESYNGLGASKIESIGRMTFFGNVAIENFELPATLTSIGNYAFGNCTSASFDFADASAITTLGEGAFNNCIRLTEFVSYGLANVGDGAFAGCYSLTSVTMVSDKPLYYQFGTASVINSYTVEYESTEYYLPHSLSTIIITPNVRTGANAAGTVVTDALFDCTSVKNVIVSEGIKLIKERAFRMDADVTGTEFRISFPSTLTEIGESAFAGRTDMKSVVLPINLEVIGDYAFYNLDKLATVTVAANNALNHVGKYTFTGTKWYTDFDGVVYIGRVALGISEEYIASIGKSSFDESDFIGLDSVADYAFADNTRLSSVILPDNVIYVGDGAFANDSALRSISFGSGCALGEGVVKGCYRLEDVTIGLSKTVEGLFGRDVDANMSPYVKNAETYYVSPVLTNLTLIADEENVVSAGIYVGFATIEKIVLEEGITAVMDGAFVNNVALRQVSLPASLVTIGLYENYDEELAENIFADVVTKADSDAMMNIAFTDVDAVGVFGGCASLTTVTVGADSSLTTIYPKAFYGTSLTAFTVPASVTSIGAFAFGFTPLQSLTFQNGTADLDISFAAFVHDDTDDSFSNYTLTFPSNLKRVGALAFGNRSGITGINFNSGLEYLGFGSFASTGITKLTLPASALLYSTYCDVDAVVDPETGDEITPAETDSYGVFASAPIIELTLNSSLKATDIFGSSVGVRVTTVTINGGNVIDDQFRGFDTITSLILNGVIEIGKNAFRDCAGLVRVTAPYTVTSLGDYAFAGCTRLKSFVFESTSEHSSRLSTVGKYVFDGDEALLAAIFPASVTSTTFEGVFNNCACLTETNIPESVTKVGDYTFNNCASLGSIAIPESVTVIGDYAFYGCKTMEFENIKFDNLTSIGNYAFADCKLLHGVKAENISGIGDNAFDGCENLKEITIIDKKVSGYIGVDGLPKIVTVNISSSTSSIVSGAFDGCNNLSSVMIYAESGLDDLLTSLDGSNLYGGKIFVTSAGYAALSSSVKDAFAGTLYPNPTDITATYSYDEDRKTATITNITGFTGSVLFLPTYVEKDDVKYTVTAIGESALKSNAYLTELIVPFTVERIGNSAFKECTSLTTIRFEIGSKLDSIGTNAFYGCTALTSVSIPDSLRTIGDRAFYGDTNLTTVDSTIYSKLSSIGAYAFAETDSLTGFVFNGTTVYVGEKAFFRSGIGSITFGDSIRTVTMDNYSFAECYNLPQNNIDEIIASGKCVYETTTFER